MKEVNKIVPDYKVTKNPIDYISQFKRPGRAPLLGNLIQSLRTNRVPFYLDHFHIEEGAPKCFDFTNKTYMIVHINSSGKDFPCHLRVDQKRVTFSYFVNFGMRPPNETNHDKYLEGN